MVTNKGAPFLSLFVVIVSVNSRSGKTVSKRPHCGGANNNGQSRKSVKKEI
jgi:hypothetical protein